MARDPDFGWDLPPGVRLDQPGGPDDPNNQIFEDLHRAIYAAEYAGWDRVEIEAIWAMAAQDAYDDMLSDSAAEDIDDGADKFEHDAHLEHLEGDSAEQARQEAQDDFGEKYG